MTPEQFTYWLQGFVELGKGTAPTAEQWKSIQEHLSTVFQKVTPPVGETPKAIESDAQRLMREYFERTKQQQTPPQVQQPYYPVSPWIQPGPGVTYPVNPMTVTC
jgi:hypothetical protein